MFQKVLLCSLLVVACALADVESAVAQLPQLNLKDDDSNLVRHLVCFHFNNDVSMDTILEVHYYYTSLQYKCTNPTTGELYILSQDGGFANSPEGRDQGMQTGYVTTFRNTADRDYFVGRPFHTPYDPLHDAFKQYVGPLLNQSNPVFVFDYTILD